MSPTCKVNPQHWTSNVVNIQDVNSLNCNIEGHDMGTLPIDPTTVVVTDTNVSKWYMQ